MKHKSATTAVTTEPGSLKSPAAGQPEPISTAELFPITNPDFPAETELTAASAIEPEHDLPEEMTAAVSANRPSPASTGHQVHETINDDEDDEGRSESERFAEMGVGAAEREQILQAARAESGKMPDA